MYYPPCDPAAMPGTAPPVFPVQTQAPGSPAIPVALKQGALSFTNLTTGNAQRFAVGDRWQVRITGANPNTSVAVQGGKNGAQDIATVGTTDGQGNFALNGQITSDQIGSWSESWYAGGGTPAGTVNFTVVGSGAATQTSPTTPTPTPRVPATPGTTIGGFDSQTLLIGGAILIAVLLMRK